MTFLSSRDSSLPHRFYPRLLTYFYHRRTCPMPTACQPRCLASSHLKATIACHSLPLPARCQLLSPTSNNTSNDVTRSTVRHRTATANSSWPAPAGLGSSSPAAWKLSLTGPGSRWPSASRYLELQFVGPESLLPRLPHSSTVDT